MPAEIPNIANILPILSVAHTCLVRTYTTCTFLFLFQSIISNACHSLLRVVRGFNILFQIMVTLLSYISNACHSLSEVAERLQHTCLATPVTLYMLGVARGSNIHIHNLASAGNQVTLSAAKGLNAQAYVLRLTRNAPLPAYAGPPQHACAAGREPVVRCCPGYRNQGAAGPSSWNRSYAQ